ncbi:MAG: hypothetical protein M8861_12370 [marine benthic group bacterium]|nr:hypothetical protein [Gemmatimonadota bacterium]
MKRRARRTLVICLAAMGLVLGGCAGGGYPSVYVGVSGPGPYYGGPYGGYGGPYGGGYWGPGRVGGGVVITGRPY